jgi:hypothetical protein
MAMLHNQMVYKLVDTEANRAFPVDKCTDSWQP